MNVKFYILSIWNIIDPIYYMFTRLTYVGSSQNIFRVRLLKYKGNPMTLSDGTSIQRGDLLLKIHLHNVKLLKELLTMRTEVEKGKHIYRFVKASLPGVAEHVKNHPKSDHIKGLIGITLLNKGCRTLGFETYSIPNTRSKIVKWLTQSALFLLFVSQPLKTFRKQSIKYIMMPKKVLMERYSRS